MTPFSGHSGNNSASEAVDQVSAELSGAELGSFLSSGFCFGQESDRILCGWGEAIRVSEPGAARAAVYAPDFYLRDPQPWWLFPKLALIDRSELVGRLDTFLANVKPQPDPWIWQEPERAPFSRVFAQLQAAFSSGTAEKAVPVVFSHTTAPLTEVKLAHILRRGLSVKAPLRLYGVWNGSAGGMIGLTPEILFRLRGNRYLETMALAGTRRGRLSAQGEAEFLADPKEAIEHRVVIDDLTRVLTRFGTVKLGETSVLRLPTLSHLHTPLTVESNEPLDFATMAGLLHPTPALGVSPRELGLKWMKTWDDPDARIRFGAPFGVRTLGMDHKTTDCLVAIRNIQWQSGRDLAETRFTIGSGCGLVSRSLEDSEWKELSAKRESVKLLFGLGNT